MRNIVVCQDKGRESYSHLLEIITRHYRSFWEMDCYDWPICSSMDISYSLVDKHAVRACAYRDRLYECQQERVFKTRGKAGYTGYSIAKRK
jgi:hypothetical protein